MSSINYYLLREQYYLTKISKCSLCRNILKKKILCNTIRSYFGNNKHEKRMHGIYIPIIRLDGVYNFATIT
jgi:hypothetical protein